MGSRDVIGSLLGEIGQGQISQMNQEHQEKLARRRDRIEFLKIIIGDETGKFPDDSKQRAIDELGAIMGENLPKGKDSKERHGRARGILEGFLGVISGRGGGGGGGRAGRYPGLGGPMGGVGTPPTFPTFPTRPGIGSPSPDTEPSKSGEAGYEVGAAPGGAVQPPGGVSGAGEFPTLPPKPGATQPAQGGYRIMSQEERQAAAQAVERGRYQNVTRPQLVEQGWEQISTVEEEDGKFYVVERNRMTDETRYRPLRGSPVGRSSVPHYGPAQKAPEGSADDAGNPTDRQKWYRPRFQGSSKDPVGWAEVQPPQSKETSAQKNLEALAKAYVDYGRAQDLESAKDMIQMEDRKRKEQESKARIGALGAQAGAAGERTETSREKRGEEPIVEELKETRKQLTALQKSAPKYSMPGDPEQKKRKEAEAALNARIEVLTAVRKIKVGDPPVRVRGELYLKNRQGLAVKVRIENGKYVPVL